MVFAAVVPGCYGAAREERLANWSAGGRVPEVSEAIFTAGATGRALQRCSGRRSSVLDRLGPMYRMPDGR
jgi:hypothetical protein